MASEIKVDTISEKTSTNGVTIDSLSIKDGGLVAEGNIDVNGNNLVLDANANTYLDAGTDDTIKIYVAGAHDATISANAINVLSGTTLTIDSGATITNSGTANGFGALAGIDDQTSSNDDQLTITDTAVIINEDSDDLDFRVESNGNANMLFVSGGNDVVGIGNEGDLGVGLHIKSADSGAPAHADQDELVIENSAHAGLTINSGASSKGSIAFSDSGGVSGVVKYDHSTDDLIFHTEDAENLRISGGKLSTGAEASPDVDDGGICIDHNANDCSALTFKNSDVGHGMTGVEEADTYGYIRKYQGNHGGLAVVGFSDSDGGAVDINGYQDGAANNGESTGVNGIIHLNGSIRDGTGVQADGADNNILCVRNGGNTKFIVKGDGELWSDQTATVGTYDTYEDAQLIRAYDLSHMRGVIDSKFDKFVQYKQKDLLDAKLIGKDNEGNTTSFVNWTGMSRLHNGAIWQQYEKHQQLLEAVYDLAKEAVGEEKANSILEKHEVKRLQ